MDIYFVQRFVPSIRRNSALVLFVPRLPQMRPPWHLDPAENKYKANVSVLGDSSQDIGRTHTAISERTPTDMGLTTLPQHFVE